jgi:hypothetical protein
MAPHPGLKKKRTLLFGSGSVLCPYKNSYLDIHLGGNFKFVKNIPVQERSIDFRFEVFGGPE